MTAFHGNAWFTDHRAIIVDINTKALFDSDLAILPPTTPCLLQATNLHKVKLFLKALEHELPVDKIIAQCKILFDTNDWNASKANELEAIDKQLTAALLKAEHSLKKTNNFPWSPDLHQAYLIYTYWRKFVSAKTNRIQIETQLEDLTSQLGNAIYIGYRYSHPCQQLRKATKAYHKCQTNSIALRKVHLQLRHEVLSDAKQFDRAKAIQQMRTNERKLRMYMTIKKINKPNLSNGGLSFII